MLGPVVIWCYKHVTGEDPEGSEEPMNLESTVEPLVDRGMRIAIDGATDWALSNGRTVADLKECLDTFTDALKAEVSAAFTEALKDAKDAFGAGMPQIATATFSATMRLAGIKAAQIAFGVTPIA